MRYQGGKGHVAVHLAPEVLAYAAGRRIIEPFHGGLSMTRLLRPVLASDLNQPLHNLVTAVRSGWMPPEHLHEEEFLRIRERRHEVDDPLVCYAGQCCTFGGMWFGSYARDWEPEGQSARRPVKAARARLLKLVAETRSTEFRLCGYEDVDVRPGDLIYCDPPYRGTTHSYPVPPFDTDAFFDWTRWATRQGAKVVVSEYDAPADFQLLWSRDRPNKLGRSNNTRVKERLFLAPPETEEIKTMTYEKLGVEAFGRQLIETGDLDPVYIALSKCEWDEKRLQRWLMAYWCFYHPGLASYMSDIESEVGDGPLDEQDFWSDMSVAAENNIPSPIGGRWPRASERRHFRGQKAVDAVHELRRDGLDNIFTRLERAAPDYRAVAKEVCSLPQFGPWMAFKVADMLERVCGVPVDFNLGSVTMFDDPKKAALMVWKVKAGFDPYSDAIKPKDPERAIREVVEYLIEEYKDLSAPPARDRPVGYQEVETVLCKWKSHMNGHYPVGNDIREIRRGLSEWVDVSDTAREFLHHMPSLEDSTPGDSAGAPPGDRVAA